MRLMGGLAAERGVVGLAWDRALERPLLRRLAAAGPPADQGARRPARSASAS
jgi:hypothetical protein